MSEDDKSVANGPQAQPRHDPRSRRHVPPIDATIPHGAAAAPEVRPPMPHDESAGNAAPSIKPVSGFPPVSEAASAPPVELGLRDDEDLFAAVSREPRRPSEEVESTRLEPVFGDFPAASAPEQPAEPEPRIELEPHYGPDPEPQPATFVAPQIFPSEPEHAPEPSLEPSYEPEPSYAPEPRIEFEPEPVTAQSGGDGGFRTHEPEEHSPHRMEEPQPEQPSYPETPVFEEPTIQHADVREEPELAGIAATERPVPPRRRSRAGWFFVAAAMVLIALGTAWALNGGQLLPAGTETASNEPPAEAAGADTADAANADGLRSQIGDLEKRVAALEQRLGEQTPATPDNASNEDQVKALDSRIGNLEDKANTARAADAVKAEVAPKPAETASTDANAPADAKPAIRNVTPDASVNPPANGNAVETIPAPSDQADAAPDAAQPETASIDENAPPASLAPSSPVPPALPQPRPQFAARSFDNGNGFLQPPPSRATYDRPYDQPYGNRYPPPQERQPNVVLRGWSVRDVYQGMALLQTSDGLGMIRVRPGDELPNGGGRITSIRRLPTGWAVMTTRGIITSDY